jgi:drug/metabolite transporter (DMT)-like permease
VTVMRGVADYPAMTGQAVRYAVAAAILLVLARLGVGAGGVAGAGSRAGDALVRNERPTGRDWLVLTANAATGLVVFTLCTLTAVRHADPAVVGTIVGAAPVGLAIAGPLLRGQPPAVRLIGAAGVIAVGTAFVHGAGSADLIGTLAAIGALVCEVLFSVLASLVLPRLGAVRVAAYSCLLAVPLLLTGAAVAGEFGRARLPTEHEALVFAYLAVMLTVVAFLSWFTGLSRLGVARAGLFVGVLPIATLVTTSVQDGQWPPLWQTLGVLVVALALAAGLTGKPRTSGRVLLDELRDGAALDGHVGDYRVARE